MAGCVRYRGDMPADPQSGAAELVCPHCSKPFTAPMLPGGHTAGRGFKCPHCRLFVPLDRAAQSGS